MAMRRTRDGKLIDGSAEDAAANRGDGTRPYPERLRALAKELDRMADQVEKGESQFFGPPLPYSETDARDELARMIEDLGV